MTDNIVNKGTSFAIIYDSFLTKVTDDMYMELTELDTYQLLQDLLLAALHKFEFPRFDIYDYEEGFIVSSTYTGVESENTEVPATLWAGGSFNTILTAEEVNIISAYMIVEWLGQQLATTENTRTKYSGSDFKFASQANHMAKLKVIKENYEKEAFHLQRLYKRRKIINGKVQSTFGQIMEVPGYGFKI